MADSIFDVLSSSEQMRANYQKYADRFKDSTAELVNSETFLNLLVAEMTNQDPLEPTSNTEFVTQMAQFTQLQYAQDSSKYSMATYASSLVGKTATGTKMDGGNLVTKTGVVSSVEKNGDNYSVIIDGISFDLSKITKVSETQSSSSSSGAISTGNELGDMISRASLMIGMYATVNANTGSGNALDAGVIDSIQVKNGEISAVINGISYKLSDVIELSYAKPEISVPDEEGTQPVEGVDKADDTSDAAVSDENPEEVIGSIETEYEDEDLEDISDELLEQLYDIIGYPEDYADETVDETADETDILENLEEISETDNG